MTNSKNYISVVNNVVVNRTVGFDVTVPLSVPEPGYTVHFGWVTIDGGQTFTPPPPAKEDVT